MGNPKFDLDTFWKTVPAPYSVGFTEAIDTVQRQIETGRAPGYMTGIPSLDKFVRLIKSEYMLIGGRSGDGKTAMAMQLIDTVEKQRKERGVTNEMTVFFSAEMNKETLAMRHAAKMTGISQWQIQSGAASRTELQTFLAALQDARPMYRDIFVDETSNPTIDHMLEHLTILQKEWNIGLVVFDYLELSGEPGGSENLRIAAISRGMKAIAKHFRCSTLGLSQLSRSVEQRADKTPKMSDIMYGGEREPDRIVLLQRSEEQEDRTDAYVVKNRNGPTGKATMIFDGPRQLFASAEVKRTPLNP